MGDDNNLDLFDVVWKILSLYGFSNVNVHIEQRKTVSVLIEWNNLISHLDRPNCSIRKEQKSSEDYCVLAVYCM